LTLRELTSDDPYLRATAVYQTMAKNNADQWMEWSTVAASKFCFCQLLANTLHACQRFKEEYLNGYQRMSPKSWTLGTQSLEKQGDLTRMG
jgi:hypothetical protein